MTRIMQKIFEKLILQHTKEHTISAFTIRTIQTFFSSVNNGHN